MKVTRILRAKRVNKGKEWTTDSYLRRVMRQRWPRGHNNPRKCEPIRTFNLGRKKLDRSADKVHARIRDIAFKAVHAVVDKAAVIAAEDLTAPMAGKSFGKNINRRLSAWTKGVISEALDRVSSRRGSAVVLVNPAYTSQIDSRTGCLDGKRRGDRFYCSDEVVCYRRTKTLRETSWHDCLTPTLIGSRRSRGSRLFCWNGPSASGWDCSTRTPVARPVTTGCYQRRANHRMRTIAYEIRSSCNE